MDFLLDALGEIATGIFDRTANLLNLSCDVIFVDTSSTYWEVDVADEEIELSRASEAEKEKEDESGERGGPAVPGEVALASVLQAQQGSPKRPATGGDRDGSDLRGRCRFAAGPSRGGRRTSSSSGGSRMTSGAGC